MNKDDCISNGKPCPNYNLCNHPCLYLQMLYDITGMRNSPCMEMLGPPETTDDRIHTRDYKEVLIEMQENKLMNQQTTIKEIRELGDLSRRAVAALLYANITLKDTAYLLNKSVKTIRRICKD